jgi:hypothetical protein
MSLYLKPFLKAKKKNDEHDGSLIQVLCSLAAVSGTLSVILRF